MIQGQVVGTQFNWCLLLVGKNENMYNCRSPSAPKLVNTFYNQYNCLSVKVWVMVLCAGYGG